MNDKEALLLSISLMETANARLRDQISRGERPLSPEMHASYVTAWAWGVLVVVSAAMLGYSGAAAFTNAVR